LIDREIYSGLKDKVLDTPDSLSRFTAEKQAEKAADSAQGFSKGGAMEEKEGNVPIPGTPRMVTVPDSKLTPSEVVIACLDALQNNNR
jgi:hypothetical protein